MIPFLDAADVERLLPPAGAVDALERALLAGLDPEADPPRSIVEAPRGELLLMPSTAAGPVGVKLATIAPANPDRGLPRIQGVYALFDPETLAPVALVDAIALTSLRTAAVSALAVRRLASPEASRLLVFGTGPQGWAHVLAMREVRPIVSVLVAGRDPGRLQTFVHRCRSLGIEAAVADASTAPVKEADVICCCTTARKPLFEGALVADGACVVAVGSHEASARELDAGLLGRSTVVVEAVSPALREAGDVIQAVDSGELLAESIVTLPALVRGGATAAPDRPRVFKSTGMAWEDAVVAAALAECAGAPA